MSRFVRLETHDPFVTFAISLRRHRTAIERAFYAAFAASDASNEAMQLYNWESSNESASSKLLGTPFPKGEETGVGLKIRYAEAISEDSHCDMQATLVVLFADDLLQRFARKVFGKKMGLNGYGPLYRSVHLTTVLRATTNCVRHVSDWEDLPFPYPESDRNAGADEHRAIQNIEVLQKVYGLGKHERIRDFVSWHTVVTIDGLYGTHSPDYQRFEDALVEGARDIARHVGGTALTDLERALRERALAGSV